MAIRFIGMAGILTAVLAGASIVQGEVRAAGNRVVLSRHANRRPAVIRRRVPLVAVALHGDIYAVPATGGPPRRLTAYGLNSNPALSPDGQRMAYLSTSPRFLFHGVATTHSVWVVPADGRPNGSSAVKITVTDPSVDRGNLSWSPDGRSLAYDEGDTVVVETPDGSHRIVVLRGVSPSPIAWSPDGLRVAIVVAGTMSVPAQIAVARIDGGGQALTTVHFVQGSPGEAVVGPALAWALDGRHLLFETIAMGVISGRGSGFITGLWQLALGDGRARLIEGNRALTTHKTATTPPPASNPALDSATNFALSPDRTHLATDPLRVEGNAQGDSYPLWLTDVDGAHGHPLPPDATVRSCQTTQFVWLPDSTTLAFVSVCPVSSDDAEIARLYSIATTGAAPRLLYAARYLIGKQAAGTNPVYPVDLTPAARSLPDGEG